MRNFAHWYWAAWFILGFGVFETIALVSGHPEWTLSETVWDWFGVSPGATVRSFTIPHLILVLFLVWALGHLGFGAWKKL